MVVVMRNNNVPALRLEGFSGEWERVSVDEVATRHDNERIPVTQKDRIPGPTPYYGANGIQDYVRGFTHEGPLVLVAEDGANDLSNYPVQYVTGYAWVNNHAHVLRCKPKTADDYFLKVALSHSDIKSLLVGGGRAKLNAAQLMQISFCKPTLEEQQVIGAIFTNLDSAINQHTLKHKALQQSKTALMQRMFPQEGQTVPELRLEGFSGEWEVVKFGDFFRSTQLGINDLGEAGQFGTPLLKMGNIQRGYFDLDVYERLPESVSVSPEYLIYSDDFLINTRNTLELVGKGATWTGRSGVFTFNGNIARLELVGVDRRFFNYLYNLPSTIADVHKRATGTTSVAAIYPKTLESIEFLLPTFEEQQAISAVFTQLDTLIAAEAQYIVSLKQAKTALLQRMFI